MILTLPMYRKKNTFCVRKMWHHFYKRIFMRQKSCISDWFSGPTGQLCPQLCIMTVQYIYSLKVDGNEKLGGLRFLQLLGIGLRPWRSMSIFILNVPFAIEKHISFSALSSKLNRRFVWQKAMRIKQDLLTYNPPIYLRTECSE